MSEEHPTALSGNPKTEKTSAVAYPAQHGGTTRTTWRGNKGTILVVDDDEGVCRITQAQLRRFGYTVLTAANGRDCLEEVLSDSSEVDLILLDLSMPVMSGLETVAVLDKSDCTIPVILVSGYERADITLEVASLPCVAFLQKPYTIEELLFAITSKLQNNQ